MALTRSVYCCAVRGAWGGPEKYSLMLSPKVNSSLIAPPMMGILLYCPVVQASYRLRWV